MSFLKNLFKPKIKDEQLNQKYKNEDGDGEEGSNSQNDEQEEEKNTGIWGFLKNIINLVEKQFSKEDRIEVKEIGKKLNSIGAKFLGEIKVGKRRNRGHAVEQAIGQAKGKNQQR